MKNREFTKIRLLSGLKQFSSMLVKDNNEREALIDGLENLSEKQLFQLKSIVLQNPKTLSIIAKQSFQKKIILDKKDKKAWIEMLQKEEQDLGKHFLKIMDDDINKADRQTLDKIRKEL